MLKKILLFIFVSLILLIGTVLIFGPDYAKDYIEDHDIELVGRKITIENIDFNVFNGHFTIQKFKLYEQDTQRVFVQFDTLFTNLKLYTLFKGEFLAEALYLNGTKISIEIKDEAFNFSDLLTKEDTSAAKSNTSKPFIERFIINDIRFTDGGVDFENYDNSASHHLTGISFKVPGVKFGDEHTQAGIEFAFAAGGTFSINLDYGMANNEYVCEMEVNSLDLHPYLIYMKPYLKINDFQGKFSGDFTVKGDLDDPGTPKVNGSFKLDEVSLIDETNEEVFRVSSVLLTIEKLNLKNKQFICSQFYITNPYVHGIVYKDTDNLRSLLQEIEKDSITEPKLDNTPITYLVEDFKLKNGTFYIENKSLRTGNVEYTVSEINFSTNHLTEGSLVTFDVSALLNGSGKLKAKATLDPGNPGAKASFDLDIKDLEIKDFSKYSLQSTAYPIHGGRLTFQTKNKVKDNWLNSHLVMKIYKTKIGNKNKNIKPDFKVPLKLGVSVMEDQHKLINIDAPLEGDLEDPEFKYTKLIWKAVINVLVKAATSPYNLLAGSVGADENQIKFIKYDVMQVELGPEQTTQLDLISDLLTLKPELNATGSFTMDEERERKLLKFYIAKRGFYLQKEYKSDTAKVALNYVDKVKIYNMEHCPYR